MASRSLQLTPDEIPVAEKFFAACDARVEGFRLGMEAAKLLFAQFLIAQRKTHDGPGRDGLRSPTGVDTFD